MKDRFRNRLSLPKTVYLFLGALIWISQLSACAAGSTQKRDIITVFDTTAVPMKLDGQWPFVVGMGEAVLYGGYYCGFYISHDTGRTWSNVGSIPDRVDVEGVSSHPRSIIERNRIVEIVPLPDTAALVCGEDGSLWRYDSHGRSLERCAIGDSIRVAALVDLGDGVMAVGTITTDKRKQQTMCVLLGSFDQGLTWHIQEKWRGDRIDAASLVARNRLVVLYSSIYIRDISIDRLGHGKGVTRNLGVGRDSLPRVHATRPEREYRPIIYFADSLHGFMRGMPYQTGNGYSEPWKVYVTLDGGTTWSGRPDSVFPIEQIGFYDSGAFGASRDAIYALAGHQRIKLLDLHSWCMGACLPSVIRLNVSAKGTALVVGSLSYYNSSPVRHQAVNLYYNKPVSTWTDVSAGTDPYR